MTETSSCNDKSISYQECSLLTIIVPVYNEMATIVTLLQRVWDIPLSKQIVVVNDCSTDGTRQRLLNWEHASEVTIVSHDRNRGKGAAIRIGLEHARG